MADSHQNHDGHDDHDDHGGMGKYLVVFLCLLGLTILSFATGSLFTGPDGGGEGAKTVGWAVMMAVSCAKALLVMLFFMHLIWEANWKYVLTIPATVMSMLLIMALVPDVGRREQRYSEERWRYAPELSVHASVHDGEHKDGEKHGDGHDDGEGHGDGEPHGDGEAGDE